MEAWVTRTLSGLVAADDDTRKLVERHKVGSTFPVDIPSRLTRSGAWHRRYWVLMSAEAAHRYRIYGLCKKHVQLERFPVTIPALVNPPVESICPWCEQKKERP